MSQNEVKATTPPTPDLRPWTTVSIRLPEDVRIQFERALWLASVFGYANSKVEAIEALAVSFSEAVIGDYEQVVGDTKGLYNMRSLEVLEDCGFRCILCSTSRDLQIHHMFARGGRGPERPADIDCKENLAPLCVHCHLVIVQPSWRDWLPQLKLLKAAAILEVRERGYRLRDESL